jgi:mannan endo-1,4-beta-mannosidase
MKRMTSLFVLAALLLSLLALPAGPSQAATGFHISGRNLLDANGNNFIMRGINHAHTWYPAQTSAFANIKNAAANTVRVVLSSGARWTKNDASDVANVIDLCKTNKLICVLEVHDTTGHGEQSGAISLAQAVAYWQEIQSVLTGQEAYVIINIGNEPYGNVNASGWINDTKNAIICSGPYEAGQTIY